ARPDLPRPDRDAAGAAPDARRVAPPHAVQAQARADRAQAARHPDVPGPDAALAVAHDRHRGRAVPDGRPDPDQPDLALGPVPRRVVDERRAARLVSRLADRRYAAGAALRPDDR